MRSFAQAIAGFVMVLAVCAFVRAAEEDNSTLTKVGDVVPKFSVQGVDGQTLTPESFKGKVVLLNFFATWCGPCNEEMPALQKVHEKYKDKAFAVVSVGREHSIDEVKKFAEEKKLTFTFAADPKREAYQLFATQFIPRTYVIDRDGKIVYQTMGFGGPLGMKDIEEAIDKALAATPATATSSARQ
jgi:peroxiredoxin